MLYDTCNYHILHYSKLIIVQVHYCDKIVHCTPYDQCTLNGTYRISATGWNFFRKNEIYLN